MATKAEEMKALEQIKKIVEGIGGADSYIGQALKGCFEIAKENIENDFWNSYKDSLETARNNLESERLMADTQRKQVADLKKENKRLEAEIEEWKGCSETLKGNWSRADKAATENWKKFREQEDKVEDLQQEIIRLKARLFDMMEAQGA